MPWVQSTTVAHDCLLISNELQYKGPQEWKKILVLFTITLNKIGMQNSWVRGFRGVMWKKKQAYLSCMFTN